MHVDWWTLAFQTANVLILIWLLARFLFRPVMDIIRSRQDEADKLLADAAEARREAVAARADLDHAKVGIADERSRALADARASAETARTALVAQATEEIRKLRADAAAAISRDRAAMERTVIEHARELALDIARRLISRVGPAVDEFLPSLSERLRALPSEQRILFTDPADGGDVEIVTAAPLAEDARERVRQAVATALTAGDGAPRPNVPSLVFRTDPAVIAGLELSTRHAAVRDSWRSDLEAIGAALEPASSPANAVTDNPSPPAP